MTKRKPPEKGPVIDTMIRQAPCDDWTRLVLWLRSRYVAKGGCTTRTFKRTLRVDGIAFTFHVAIVRGPVPKVAVAS